METSSDDGWEGPEDVSISGNVREYTMFGPDAPPLDPSAASTRPGGAPANSLVRWTNLTPHERRALMAAVLQRQAHVLQGREDIVFDGRDHTIWDALEALHGACPVCLAVENKVVRHTRKHICKYVPAGCKRCGMIVSRRHHKEGQCPLRAPEPFRRDNCPYCWVQCHVHTQHVATKECNGGFIRLFVLAKHFKADLQARVEPDRIAAVAYYKEIQLEDINSTLVAATRIFHEYTRNRDVTLM